MKKLVLIIAFFFASLGVAAQIQTKFWEVTLGVSTYKQVDKYCKQFKGHYKDEYGDFWGNHNRTIDNRRNNDPMKGEIFIETFNLLNFAGGEWKVTFRFQDNKLLSVEMVLSKYDKAGYTDFRGRYHTTNEPTTPRTQPSEAYLNNLIQILLDKYSDYFQPEESKEKNAYIFYDGKTTCELKLTSNNQLFLTYTDCGLLNNSKQAIIDDL